MKNIKSLVTCLLLTSFAVTPAPAASPSQQLQQGLYAEEVEGNINSAIKAYGEIIKDHSAPPNLMAQALYRQGMCYLKIKEEPAAKEALERLVTEYPGQTEIVAKAREALDDLTDFDPALVMPPGTLAYVEFGSPGRQLETVLNTLKGTPFENPLAAMAGQRSAGGDEGKAGNIVASLLNPSMIAEFKKIRSSAVGFTGIAQNNPPMVAVLYPGKSDALRGLTQAALGMIGPPSEPIEGMQTVVIQDFGEVAYDDKVVIVARPAGQLKWCVRQYKGLSAEPSLASTNPSFKKLGKLQRLNNLVTVWAKVDEAYAQLLKTFPHDEVPGGVFSANAFVDFANLDDLTFVESLETNGFSSRIDLQFKDGAHCLAYDLIRTPNISRAGLEAVPADAIAIASLALGPSNTLQAAQVQATIQNLTGLDVGREIFANMEQLTLFAMPGAGEAGNSPAKFFLPDHFGLAITSANPERTRQLLSTVLGTISTVSAGARKLDAGQYKIGRNGERDLYCYLDQVSGTTLLSLNPEIIRACIASAKNHKSISASGPLNGLVNQLTPSASKLVAVNAGGAIRMFSPQMNTGSLKGEQAAQMRTNLDLLARAADGTTIQLRTDEQPNHLTVDATVAGLPPLQQVIGPITQIMRLNEQSREETGKQNPREGTAAVIAPVSKAPALDGSMDDAWNAAHPYPLENVIFTPPTSANDLSASYRALWDENNLYLLVDVTDDVLQHSSDPDKWYESDSVEVYIDADNSKADRYGEKDYQYAFIWDKTAPQMRETQHQRVEGVQFALVTTGKGYRVAAKFPWSTIGGKPSAGAKIGLDVQVNDNDTGARKGKLAWHDQKDEDWQSPKAFGNAELGGLVGWWKFDETQGTVAADSSGGHHNGTLVGNAKWATGKFGGCIDLDGHDSFVRIADPSAFDFAGAVTVSCWARIRSVPVEWMAIVTKGDDAWRLSTAEKERKLHFAVTGGDRAIISGSTEVSADQWHHLAGVYDGGVMRLYIDGAPEGAAPWTEGVGRNDLEVLIGENAGEKGRFFDGLIDDVRVYNYALSETMIKALSAGQ